MKVQFDNVYYDEKGRKIPKRCVDANLMFHALSSVKDALTVIEKMGMTVEFVELIRYRFILGVDGEGIAVDIVTRAASDGVDIKNESSQSYELPHLWNTNTPGKDIPERIHTLLKRASADVKPVMRKLDEALEDSQAYLSSHAHRVSG
jgi:hypothetical protein